MKRFFSCLICTLIFAGLLFTSAYAADGSTVVYITPTGECYHWYSCSYISSCTETTLENAVNRGYRACSHCHPPELTYETVNPERERNIEIIEQFIQSGSSPVPTPSPTPRPRPTLPPREVKTQTPEPVTESSDSALWALWLSFAIVALFGVVVIAIVKRNDSKEARKNEQSSEP